MLNTIELPPLQNGDCLTVMSADPRESACKGCGEVRVIFQAHYFAFTGDPVRARCKGCHQRAAEERGGKVFVKSLYGTLPKVWAKDRRLEEHPSVKKARERRQSQSPIREPLATLVPSSDESAPLVTKAKGAPSSDESALLVTKAKEAPSSEVRRAQQLILLDMP